MGKVSALLSFILVSVAHTGAFAQDLGIDGRLRLTVRTFERSESMVDESNLQLRLNPWINLDDKGCLRIRARVSTGDRYNSERENLGVFGEDSHIDLNLKHLYLDATCLPHSLQVELGAMSTRAAGTMGMSSHGWVDGLRLSRKMGSSGIREMIVTVGNIDRTDSVNFYNRQWKSPNLVQAELDVGSLDKLSGFLSMAKFDGVGFHRLGARFGLSSYIDFIEHVETESMASEGHAIGSKYEVATKFSIAKAPVKVQFFRLHVDEEFAGQKGLPSLIKNSYAAGTNYYAEGTIGIGGRREALFIFRNGVAGPYAEFGLSLPFSVKR